MHLGNILHVISHPCPLIIYQIAHNYSASEDGSYPGENSLSPTACKVYFWSGFVHI